jgi:hypothetical protein
VRSQTSEELEFWTLSFEGGARFLELALLWRGFQPRHALPSINRGFSR